MLADGVVEHAHVAPHHLAGLALDDVPGGGREIIGQELAEVPLADEADPGRVLLVHDGFQIELVGDLPDLGLGYVRKREKAGIYLLFAEETKEVRLVLVSILGLHYVDVAVLRLCFAGVMPHRDLLIAVIEGELQKRVELDVLVAENVGVRGPSVLILGEEIGEHRVPVFLDEIDPEQLHPEPSGRLLGVLVVLLLRALRIVDRRVAEVVAIGQGVPVAHEGPVDVVPLFLQ